MKKTLSFIVLLSVLCAYSQQDYSISNLTAELTHQANSVIINKETRIIIDAYDKMHIVENKMISVLNEKGLSAIEAFAFYDKSTKIKNLKVTVYNSLGSEIKVFKERDFMDVSVVDNEILYTDNRVKYLKYTPLSYPVTLHIEKEVKTSNTAFIRSFKPYTRRFQSIKKMSFQVENNSGVELRSLGNDFMEDVQIEGSTCDFITYTVENLPAIPSEVYSPSLDTFTPKVMFALQTFELEGESGFANSWSDFGRWQYENLLKGQDELPESTLAEIQSITQNLTTKAEKAKAVYKYVQDNFRYINVQIGIGGWMPISAEEVDDNKYGDCKGLTNYTKALLTAVGIESNYCVVQAGNNIQNIAQDFASMQGNHVILNIPQDDEDIWLECTSQDIPFNFLGTFTDNRNVLAIKPTGGEILRTPVYSEEDNHQFTKAEINIIDKELSAEVKITTKGTQYDSRYSLNNYTDKETKSYYKTYWKNLKDLSIENYQFSNNKEDIVFTEMLRVKDKNYAKIYGNDLILDINPFNKYQTSLPNYKTRMTPFVIERGFVDEDEFVFDLEGLSLNTSPEDVVLNTKYGTYRLSFEESETELIVKRYLKFNKNRYQKSDYQDFVEFLSTVSNFDNTKLSLSFL